MQLFSYALLIYAALIVSQCKIRFIDTLNYRISQLQRNSSWNGRAAEPWATAVSLVLVRSLFFLFYLIIHISVLVRRSS